MPNKRRKKVNRSDPSLLEMALVGYESAKDAIDQKISDIRKMIGGGSRAITNVVQSVTAKTPKRRTMSAAGRKRVAAAQRKRWAEKRKADAVAITPKTKTAKKGPKLTAAATA